MPLGFREMMVFNLIDPCINLFQKLVSDEVFNRKTINYSLLPDSTKHGWKSRFFIRLLLRDASNSENLCITYITLRFTRTNWNKRKYTMD